MFLVLFAADLHYFIAASVIVLLTVNVKILLEVRNFSSSPR